MVIVLICRLTGTKAFSGLPFLVVGGGAGYIGEKMTKMSNFTFCEIRLKSLFQSRKHYMISLIKVRDSLVVLVWTAVIN
ncbi:hypothetical protein D8911_01870 [Levilactobacillus brevis]|nr:hypothetical protein D8911_01870 [Levilactobacillus brevis]